MSTTQTFQRPGTGAFPEATSWRPTVAERTDTRWLLFGMLIVCGFVDAVRALGAGSMSGGGAVTLLGCAAVWCSWLARPYLPSVWLKSLLPLLMFDAYATGSLLWYSPGTPGVQQMAVYLSFFGFIVLTARETERHPELAGTLHRVLLGGSVIAVVLYAKVYLDGGLGADGIVGARSYALYALVPLATSLAVWQASGQRRWLAAAGVLLTLIFLSMSRTAMVAGLLAVPLAIGLRGDRRSVGRAMFVAGAVAAAFAGAVLSYAPLYDRFFANDASMNVGGVAVNASGRTAMWNMVLDSLGHDWVFGKGIASSANLIATYFPELAQPHNDFLRFYYDFGVVGLMLWLAFVVQIVCVLLRHLHQTLRTGGTAYAVHLAPLLAIVAVTITMFTDNSVTYYFVMVPVGILIGCSLGVSKAHSVER